MKKNILVLLSLPLLWSHHATAAPSVDLKVIGKIKPAACELIFTNGSTVDLGVISKRTLNQDRRTLLEDENIGFTIRCDAPTWVYLDMKDQRAGSAAQSASLKDISYLYGLGKVAATNIGAFTLSFDQRSTADGREIPFTNAPNRTDWNTASNFLKPNQRHSWSDRPRLDPSPFSVLSGTMILSPSIVPARELPAQDEIPIDGLATFELNYQ